MRTVKQLTLDEGVHFPKAAKVVPDETYVDDIVNGADSVAEAIALQQELTDLFAKGGFSLHKWGSNNDSVLKSVPEKLRVHQSGSLDLDKDSTKKVLGMEWDSSMDSFHYDVQVISDQWSKRKILSTIARLFDPLGFLAPTIMVAKLIMQVLWDSQVGWDDPLPKHILEQWTKFHDQPQQLTDIRIERFIPNIGHKVNLYCFADASERGYAAVIYVKHPAQESVKLLVAKTRVAPLKRVSLPRLELCAALLASRLVRSIKATLSDCIGEIYAFSDSMVTLEWLRSPSYKWTTFVANRVSEIQDIIPFKHWRHVKSKDNAADCASQGLLPSQLINDPMWWSGPKWLLSSPRQWPRSNESATHDDVKKEMASKDFQKLCFLATNDFDLIKTFTSLKTLLRVVVRILRLARKIRCKDIPPEQIIVLEMDNALTALIRVEQNRYFHEEIKAVKASKKLSRNLKKLNPFVDDDNLLRVGGRLNLAPLAYDQRHPILLPANGHLTELLIWHYHIKH